MPASETLTQNARVASLETPLGTDKLVLARFEGCEGLSELFEFQVEALSTEEDIDFDTALGLPCTVKVGLYQEPRRFFNGILVEARALGMVHDLYSYRLVLRPHLWILSRTANCRIWHEKTALDIIKEVLKDGGVTINRPPRDGHMAFIRSPDGISIELLQDGHLEPKEPWASMPNTGSW